MWSKCDHDNSNFKLSSADGFGCILNSPPAMYGKIIPLSWRIITITSETVYITQHRVPTQ